MKPKTLELMAVCLATALCAQISLAQQSDQTQSQQPGRTKDTSNQANDPTKSGIRLSKLIGAEVKSNNGENLGRLEDVVIDPQTGKPTFAVIGKGGILRLGEKRLPVPWQALTIDSQKRVTLNMDKTKMDSAPTIDSDYANLDNPDFVVVVYRFYEIPLGGTGAAIETPGSTDTGTSSSQSTPSSSNPKSSSPNPNSSNP